MINNNKIITIIISSSGSNDKSNTLKILECKNKLITVKIIICNQSFINGLLFYNNFFPLYICGASTFKPSQSQRLSHSILELFAVAFTKRTFAWAMDQTKAGYLAIKML